MQLKLSTLIGIVIVFLVIVYWNCGMNQEKEISNGPEKLVTDLIQTPTTTREETFDISTEITPIDLDWQELSTQKTTKEDPGYAIAESKAQLLVDFDAVYGGGITEL